MFASCILLKQNKSYLIWYKYRLSYLKAFATLLKFNHFNLSKLTSRHSFSIKKLDANKFEASDFLISFRLNSTMTSSSFINGKKNQRRLIQFSDLKDFKPPLTSSQLKTFQLESQVLELKVLSRIELDRLWAPVFKFVNDLPWHFEVKKM